MTYNNFKIEIHLQSSLSEINYSSYKPDTEAPTNLYVGNVNAFETIVNKGKSKTFKLINKRLCVQQRSWISEKDINDITEEELKDDSNWSEPYFVPVMSKLKLISFPYHITEERVNDIQKGNITITFNGIIKKIKEGDTFTFTLEPPKIDVVSDVKTETEDKKRYIYDNLEDVVNHNMNLINSKLNVINHTD